MRKVFPDPPLDEKIEMMCPRCVRAPSDLPPPAFADRRFAAHAMARSTASRSSSVPWVMSTTSRIPARIAAGSSPFHV